LHQIKQEALRQGRREKNLGMLQRYSAAEVSSMGVVLMDASCVIGEATPQTCQAVDSEVPQQADLCLLGKFVPNEASVTCYRRPCRTPLTSKHHQIVVWQTSCPLAQCPHL